MTVPMVMARLEEVADNIIEVVVRTEVAAAYRELQEQLPSPAAAVATTTTPCLNLNRGYARPAQYIQFTHTSSRVPKGRRVVRSKYLIALGLQFPTPCFKDDVWFQWFGGLVDNRSKKEDLSGRYIAPVNPFRAIEPKMLPHKTKEKKTSQ